MAAGAERVRFALPRMYGSLGVRTLRRTRRGCEACLEAGRRFARCDRGVAAIEFGLLAPLFLLILVAVIDIGMVLRARFLLNTELSSAANNSLVHGGIEANEDPVDFAEQIARQLGAGRAVESANVLVNQAASATLAGDEVTSADQGKDVSLCYCPTRAEGAISWGDDRACLSTCPDGNSAGQYIEITASTSHSSFFGRFISSGDDVSVHTLVRIFLEEGS